MKIIEKEKQLVFRCGKAGCNRQNVTIRAGSIFYGSRLSCRKLMKLARSWLQGESRNATVRSTKVNKETVTTWFMAFRELVASSLRETSEKIGGEGTVVQVDETKLGKRKFHCGHRVEGVWVVCGIEMGTAERRAFCVQVETRDNETLHDVIRKNVIEGSEVWTDGWKGYCGVSESCSVRHSVVNHSLHFKDPSTGVCTNTVEGLNSALSLQFVHSIGRKGLLKIA
jgi:transposase-like protein